MHGSTLELRVKQFLTPPGFFLGLVLGFAACCLFGRQAPKLAPFSDTTRLHSALNPETLYYPTALQMRAWARRELPRDKIAVVIGGDSTFYGLGQTPDRVWTKQLQDELGAEFRVLNVAVCGGAPNGYGLATTEMLARDHPRLLYVCNCPLGRFTNGPDGGKKAFRHLFHDARARGLLLPDRERDAAQARFEALRKTQAADAEMHLRTGANRLLSFNDFWHVVGYRYFFSVWTAHEPWQARQRKSDDAPFRDGVHASQPELKKVLHNSVRSFTQDEWAGYEAKVRQAIPEPLRQGMLVVIVSFNPADVALCEAESPGFATNCAKKTQLALSHLRACGVQAVSAGADLDASGFVDCLHLNERGGERLAQELAPVIYDMAKKRGFLELPSR